MEQRAGLLRRERLGWREKSGGRDWRRLKEGDGSVWSGRCVWSSSLLPAISESSAVLSIHSGYPFLCATAPPPSPTHTHTHTPLKQPFSYVTLLEVEPPVLILEFLSCHGTREVQCLPFQLFFFPLHDGCSTLSFFLSRRSQFWLGANNERKQEDRSERGMNWEHPLRCLLLYAHHLLFRVNSGKQEVTWLRMESTGAAMTPSTALRCI